MTKLIAILISISLTANAQDTVLANEIPAYEDAKDVSWLSGIYLLLLEQEMVSASAPDTGEGTCSVIINGILYFYWCDVNDPLPSFDVSYEEMSNE